MPRRRRRLGGGFPIPLSGEVRFPPVSSFDWTVYDGTYNTNPVVFTSQVATTPTPTGDILDSVQINNTSALQIYRNTDSYTYARVATRDSDGIVTFGNETLIESENVESLDGAFLGNNNIILGIQSDGSFKAIRLYLLGNTINIVDTAIVSTTSGKEIKTSALSANEFLIKYIDGSNNSNTWYGSIATGKIVMGSNFPTISNNIISVSSDGCGNKLLLGTIAVSGAISYFLGNIVNNTVSPLDSYTNVIGTDTTNHKAKVIAQNKVLVVWRDDTNNKGQAVILTQSANSISYGTVIDFTSLNPDKISIAAVSDEYAVISYTVGSTSARSAVLSISGTALTLESDIVIEAGDNDFISSAPMGEEFVFTGYRDNDNSQEGHSITLVRSAPFVTTWKTDNSGISNNNQITIPTEDSLTGAQGTYNCVVDWGDGTSDVITTYNDPAWTHTYPTAGTYTVKITGQFEGFYGDYILRATDGEKLLSIEQWGTEFRFTNAANPANGRFFGNCANLVINATDIPNLTNVTRLSCFLNCDSLTNIPNLNLWDTSNVTDFSNTFSFCELFDGVGAESFNTDSATEFWSMFENCSNANVDISGYNFSSVTNAYNMMRGSGFSQVNYDLLLQSLSTQTLQSSILFHAGNAKYAAKPLRDALINDNSWTITDGGLNAFAIEVKTDNAGTSSNTEFAIPTISGGTYDCDIYLSDGTFTTDVTTYNAAAMTPDFGSTGTYQIYIGRQFEGIQFADGGDKLKLLEVSNWGSEFKAAILEAFMGCANMDVTATDTLVLGASNARRMFAGCSSLVWNSSVDNIDTSAVDALGGFFQDCVLFNQQVDSWDVSSVTAFGSMFQRCSVYNQALSSWTTSSATTFSNLFDGCTAFNQDISNFDFSNVTSATNMFRDSGFNQTNYDLLLPAIDAQSVQNGVGFHAGNAQYGAGAPATARANLIADHSWTITDGGAA